MRSRKKAFGWWSAVRLVFDSNQSHQREAIEAVLDAVTVEGAVPGAHAVALGSRTVLANRRIACDAELDLRIRAHQRRMGLPEVGAVWTGFPQLCVEMETGTGKTYVFLRTALELARRVGWRKFVIVVPSVAIREGVLATLRATREHFVRLYPDLPLHFFSYARGQWGAVVRFAESRGVEIAVITIDAFNRDKNVFRQPQDRCAGWSPLAWWQATHPVLILDEAHHLETPLRVQALGDLQPCIALRYGATHRHATGLVHRLTAAQAHRRGLVKTIEVVGTESAEMTAEQRFSAQIDAMVEAHIARQRELAPRGIKVLSLVFLERVADYIEDGLVARLFDASFDRHKVGDPWFESRSAKSVRAAYFAVRRDRPIDSQGRSATDRDAYDLILRDRERLLDFEEPVSFVFSHSALREGWDNPNVFQICTLARAHSSMRKRQEIGRGIRLAVDQSGRRIFDRDVQVLRVFANESYEAYVAGLQRETALDRAAGDAWVPPRPAGRTPGRSGQAAGEGPTQRPLPAVLRTARAQALVRSRLEDLGGLPTSRSPAPMDLIDLVLERLGPRPVGGYVSRRMVEAVLACVRPRSRLLDEPVLVVDMIVGAFREVGRSCPPAGAATPVVGPPGTTRVESPPDTLSAMTKIELRIRRLEEGDVVVAEFADVDAAETWLRERPPFVEVLRMETPVAAEIEARLRSAMRPLDDRERERQEEHQRTLLSQRTAELQQVRVEDEEAPVQPDRLMHLRWERTRGLTMVDAHDDRTIPPVVYDAVDAWVAERDTWVVDRGEWLVAATLSVWPATIPSGRDAERVIPGGQFVTGKLPSPD